MITVQIDNKAEPWLRRMLAQARNPRQLLMAAGRAVANMLHRHYTEVNRSNPNKLGGPRTNFWLEVKRSVQAPAMQGQKAVSVAVSHPVIGHKVTGGVIHAKRVKFLTIPVSPEAYGRTAATLEHELGVALIPIITAGAGVLAQRHEGGDRLTVHYILKRSVMQQPDPDALPAQAKIIATVKSTMERVLQQQLNRN